MYDIIMQSGQKARLGSHSKRAKSRETRILNIESVAFASSDQPQMKFKFALNRILSNHTRV